MKECPYCGFENEDTRKTCYVCETDLKKEQ